MKGSKLSGVAVALLFCVTSCACLVSASEDEGAPLMITEPAGEDPISCAVFFADNMVYAPQWRVDNYVRIEMMVLDMTEFEYATDIPDAATDLYPSLEYPDPLSQQVAIMNYGDEVLPLTKMVSVSYIQVVLTLVGGSESYMFEAGWDPESRDKVIDDGFLGREVNRMGHLIYGMLWNTEGVSEGAYTVDVRLGMVYETFEGSGVWEVNMGESYDVNYCIGHLYDPTAEVEGTYENLGFPYSDLVEYGTESYAYYKNGAGGIEGDSAWVELGPLIPQGSGGGNGDGGGGNGAGNSWQGNK